MFSPCLYLHNLLILIFILQIRSGLAELELKTSQVLQRLENVRTEIVPPTPTVPEATPNAEGNVIPTPVPAAATVASALLQSDKKPPADILKNLESLVAFSDNEDDQEFPLPV